MATAIPVVTASYQNITLLTDNDDVIAATSSMTLPNPKNQTIVFYVINNSAMTSTNVTVTSVIDQAGRGGGAGNSPGTCDDHGPITVAAGEMLMFGPYSPVWWNQPDGVVNVSFSATAMGIDVIGVQIA